MNRRRPVMRWHCMAGSCSRRKEKRMDRVRTVPLGANGNFGDRSKMVSRRVNFTIVKFRNDGSVNMESEQTNVRKV